MNRLNNTYRLRVLRVAFLIAGVLLLGAQLSVYRHVSRHPHAIHHQRPNNHLTLDKRYDSGPAYGPVPPVFSIGCFEPGDGARRCILGVATASRIQPSPSPRGPPCPMIPTV